MDFNRAQHVVHRQIVRFGGGADNVILRRGVVDRTCTGAELTFDTSDREGSLTQLADLQLVISGLSLAGKAIPDQEQDKVVWRTVVYKMLAPPSRLATEGSTVLYYNLMLRKG